jgi:hypothetical protein
MRKATSALWAALFARPVDPDKEGECPHASQVGFIRRNANVTTPNRARSVPDTGNPESLTVHHTQPYYISESRKSPYDFWAGLADFTIRNLFDTIYLYPHFSMICDRNPGLVQSAPFGAQSRSQRVLTYPVGAKLCQGQNRCRGTLAPHVSAGVDTSAQRRAIVLPSTTARRIKPPRSPWRKSYSYVGN